MIILHTPLLTLFKLPLGKTKSLEMIVRLRYLLSQLRYVSHLIRFGMGEQGITTIARIPYSVKRYIAKIYYLIHHQSFAGKLS